MMRALLLASLACLLPVSAFAEPALVDQVERLDVERGVGELEWQSIFAGDTEDEAELSLHIFSGEYGFSDRFSLGFELGAEAEEGENLSAEYLLVQAKFVAIDPRNSPIGFGVQASVGPALNGGQAEVELEFLAQAPLGALTIAADVSVEAELDGFDNAAMRYAVRSDWSRDWGVLGIEAGGDLDAAEGEATRHWIGPAVSFEPFDAFAVELTYFRGLNDATPDDQLRIQLALEL
jgi:hypothetical protein